MKLAISNLAWPVDQDDQIARLLTRLEVRGIEVAPTKVWPDPTSTTAAQRQSFRRQWEQYGIEICAAQSLLFGHPELVIFQDAETRARTLAYLAEIITVCADLGAGPLVFGSPKNRQVGALDRQAASSIAVDFFGRLAELAHRSGTVVVLEANPPQYQADYVTSGREAIELVEAVGHPGLRLHLDAACMSLAGDDPAAVISEGAGLLEHFHISEPNLAPVGEVTAVEHGVIADELRRTGYANWISIEMRPPEPFDLAAIESALIHSRQRYLG